MEWKQIKWIEDEKITKELGKNLLSYRDIGYMSENDSYAFYVLIAGNGTIIQIHHSSYVVVLLKKKNSYFKSAYEKQIPNEVILFAIEETRSPLSERKGLEKWRKVIEEEFSIK